MVVGLALGCGQEAPSDIEPGSGGVLPPPEGETSSGDADSVASSGSDGHDEDGDSSDTGSSGDVPMVKLDVEAPGTGGREDGCAKVDFLFVIDSSMSMEDQQTALVDAFPEFMSAIVDALGVQSDHHIMVIDHDEWGRCDTANGWEGTQPDHQSCNAYIGAAAFEECDRVRGAGVVHPAGLHSSNAACDVMGGNRYIVAGQPALEETFACMATVGVAGHPHEKPMDSLVAALSPELNGPAGCNEGFVRDDALLVVTLLSDDTYYHDTPGPMQWYQAILDAKLGDPEAVVVLGLTPDWPGCLEGNGDTQGEHWTELIELFGDNGLRANVCGTAQDYVDFFAGAVSTIDEACDAYEPPA